MGREVYTGVDGTIFSLEDKQNGLDSETKIVMKHGNASENAPPGLSMSFAVICSCSFF